MVFMFVSIKYGLLHFNLSVISLTLPSLLVTFTCVVAPPLIFPSICRIRRKMFLLASISLRLLMYDAGFTSPAFSLAHARWVLYSILRLSAIFLHLFRFFTALSISILISPIDNPGFYLMFAFRCNVISDLILWCKPCRCNLRCNQ